MAENFVKYTTVQGNGHNDLDNQVNKLLAQGWQPYGNPYKGENGPTYQAMTLTKSAEMNAENAEAEPLEIRLPDVVSKPRQKR